MVYPGGDDAGSNTLNKGSSLHHNYDVWTLCTGPEDDGPTASFARASKFFFDHVLQHLLIEAEISHHLLQFGILLLELPQLPKLGYTQSAVLLFPVVKRGLADPHLSTDLLRLHTLL